MADPPEEPPAVHQIPSNSATNDVSDDCPFCTIATHYQPIDASDLPNKEWDPEKLMPPSFVLLSTEHVIAFLDIAPLTRGHVLVAPRKHRVKMGDLKPHEMAEIGSLLPLIARVVVGSILPDIPHDEADYNIVQNNGPGAAQVIPHLHFHIVPRPPLNYQPPSSPRKTDAAHPLRKSKYPPTAIPTGVQRSYIQFGRGRRSELDEEDAADLVLDMRERMREEWEAEFGSSSSSSSTTANTNPGGKGTAQSDRAENVVERFMGGIEDAAGIEGSSGLIRNLQRRGVPGRNGKL